MGRRPAGQVFVPAISRKEALWRGISIISCHIHQLVVWEKM